jgi:hypothetical protein
MWCRVGNAAGDSRQDAFLDRRRSSRLGVMGNIWENIGSTKQTEGERTGRRREI